MISFAVLAVAIVYLVLLGAVGPCIWLAFVAALFAAAAVALYHRADTHE